MTAATRRQAGLLALLVILAAVLIILRREPAAPAGAPGAASNPAASAGGGGATAQPGVADVRLDALESRREAMTPPERNPFRFGARETPEASRPAAAPPRPQPAAPPVPAGPPPPPPIPLKFIGVLEAPTRIGTVAILSDSRGNVFYGKEGDIIEGRYRVIQIGTESADVAYVDGSGRQTIRLSGQ
jgi:hypothetical protein